MKNIHFDKLSSRWYYWMILSITAVLLVYFMFTAGKGRYASESLFFINFTALILLSRNYWYSTYVQYTKHRISIRINTTSRVGINFDDLTDVEIANAKLILTSKAKTYTIDIEDVNPKDVQKLVNLLVERTEAFYKDSGSQAYYE